MAKTVDMLDQIVAMKAEIAPFLEQIEDLEKQVKAQVARSPGSVFTSTLTLPNGKRLQIKEQSRTSWQSTGLRKLAEKLGASAHELGACKRNLEYWGFTQVK